MPWAERMSVAVLSSLTLASSASPPILAQANSALPQVAVSIPATVDLDTLHMGYVLYGPFGAMGSYISPKPNVTEYNFNAHVNGVAATEVRMVLYAGGCKTQTFDLTAIGSDAHTVFNCEPLPTVLLTGKVDGFEAFQGKEANANLEVTYLAEWLCDFFGFKDCMVTEFKIADVAPHSDGSFEVRLPDFTLDANHSSARSSLQGEFQFLLRERRSGNIFVFLRPSDGPGEHNLSVQHDYPTLVHFVRRP